MKTPRKRYTAPFFRYLSIETTSLLNPSAHNEVGDPGELTRRREWWDTEEEDDDEEEGRDM